MGVSKVDYYGETLIDLTGDTVTPESVVEGFTFTNSAGEKKEGTFVPFSGDYNDLVNKPVSYASITDIDYLYNEKIDVIQGELNYITLDRVPTNRRRYVVVLREESGFIIERLHATCGPYATGNKLCLVDSSFAEGYIDELEQINETEWFVRFNQTIEKDVILQIYDGESYTVCQLADEFIPDGIVRNSYLADNYDTSEEVTEKINTFTASKAEANHKHAFNDLIDKPFGEEEVTEIVAEEQTPELYGGISYSSGVLEVLTYPAESSGDETFVVTIDGTPYYCKSWVAYALDSYTVYIGDSRMWGSDSPVMYETHPENVPFLIEFWYNEEENEFGFASVEFMGTSVYLPDNTPRTIKIEKPTDETVVKQLDEKFIPDAIARKSDVATLATDAINSGLQAAKDSGEFKGDKGDKGDTPQKGVDYFTEEDKNELIERTVEEIENRKDVTTEEIELTDMTSYLLKSGGNVVATSSTNLNRIVSEPVYAEEGETYLFTCSANYGNALYVIYDMAGESIGEVKAANTVGGNVLTDHEVTMPEGTYYFRLACNKEILPEGYSAKKVIPGSSDPIISPLNGKKWVVIGDSITEKNNRTSKNYHDYIAEETGVEVINLGVGGTGYIAGRDEGKCFYQRLEELPLADIITIFGSGNDRNQPLGNISDTDTSTVCGSINTTIDMIHQMQPTVQLGIITPTPWMNYPPYEKDNNMAKYSRAIVEICKRRGIPCLDLYHCSGLRPWDERFRELAYSKDDGDGTHPDETGHAMIYPQIRSFLLGGVNGGIGIDGADGVSATHSWDGTTLTVTSASGTSSVDLKGEKGDKGDDGYTPQKGVDYFTKADVDEIVAAVLAALPTWTGGSY